MRAAAREVPLPTEKSCMVTLYTLYHSTIYRVCAPTAVHYQNESTVWISQIVLSPNRGQAHGSLVVLEGIGEAKSTSRLK